MKGRTLVIGILICVLFVVGIIVFAMMSTINGIKEDLESEAAWTEQIESVDAYENHNIYMS